MMRLRDERFKEYKKEQNRILKLNQDKYSKEYTQEQRQERLFNTNASNKDSNLTLESIDKNNVIIFLDSKLKMQF